MCGITGFFANKELPAAVLLRMNEAIRHRGPDDEGYIFGGRHFSGRDSVPEVKKLYSELSSGMSSRFGMGFRRLSILDLSSAGHQPMVSEQKNIITFNGEIYNYLQLRNELIGEGQQFFSDTDSEVVLRAYDVWGKSMVEKLDGMFSFCIWNSEEDELFFARDRFGLKPLFYFLNDNGFFWASEIKALLASGMITPAVNWEGVQSNFTYLTTVSPLTCFQNIFSLEPGYNATFSFKTNHLVKERYFELPKVIDRAVHNDEARIEVEKILIKNVGRQLRADVPVISMMSGGIDSTLATVLAKKINEEISAFTVQYKNAGEEVSNAKMVASANDIDHQVVQISSDELLHQLKNDIAHFEEPYVTPEVLLHAAKFAGKKGYKVVLSGNAADELFGGYPHLQGFKKWKTSRKFSFLAPFLPDQVAFFKRIKNYLSLNTVHDFIRNGQGGMKPFEIRQLFKSEVSDVKTEAISTDNYQEYFKEDIRISLGSHHAFRDDLSAMKYGVEFRYPYLSNDLINYISSLPEELRFDGKQNKPLLRRVAQKYLPSSVLNMKKKGFVYPLQAWFEEDEGLRNFIDEHLQLLKKREIFNNAPIEQWRNSILEPGNLSKIWQLITFEIWLQTYID